MARQRKPLAILKAQGTYREDRHGDRADDRLASGAPAKPAWLDGEAAWAWDTIVGGLTPGVLASIDALSLGMTCRWFALWRRYDRQLAANCKNPYKVLTQAAMAQKAFDRAAAKLGLTPTDRAKLQAPPEADNGDEKERFFKTG